MSSSVVLSGASASELGEVLPTDAPIDFRPGSARPTRASTNALKSVVELMRTNENAALTIRGHTDFATSMSWSEALSLRRARAIERVLLRAGIDTNRLTAVGVGHAEPLVPLAKPLKERGANRRIVLWVRGLDLDARPAVAVLEAPTAPAIAALEDDDFTGVVVIPPPPATRTGPRIGLLEDTRTPRARPRIALLDDLGALRPEDGLLALRLPPRTAPGAQASATSGRPHIGLLSDRTPLVGLLDDANVMRPSIGLLE